MSHTPGPWVVCPATTNYIAVRASNGHIARMAITRDSVRRAEGQSNARLISAAPELLDVAGRALEFIEEEAENRAAAGSDYSDYEREPRELADLLRAIIARAQGRQ